MALAEKIRKINPRADIVSIVLQSTPRGSVPSQASWNIDGGGSGSARRPSSSRGTTPTLQSFPAKRHPGFRPFAGSDGSPTPPFTLLSGGDAAATATAAVRGGSETMAPVPTCERDTAADSDPHAAGTRSGPVRAGPDKHSSKGENSQASNRRTLETTADPPADGLGGGSGGAEDRDGRGPVESGRRSLMGRMLGSGMLERQREWAKARNRKVRHLICCSRPIVISVVGPTGPHPSLRQARRPNRGHIREGGWMPSYGDWL